MVGALPRSDPSDESDLSDQSDACRHKKRMSKAIRKLTLTHSPLSPAVRTRLELATPCVTGRYSNQLNYRTSFKKLPGLLASAQRSEHRGFVSRLRVQSYSLFWNRANFSTTFFEVFFDIFITGAIKFQIFSMLYTQYFFNFFLALQDLRAPSNGLFLFIAIIGGGHARVITARFCPRAIILQREFKPLPVADVVDHIKCF